MSPESLFDRVCTSMVTISPAWHSLNSTDCLVGYLVLRGLAVGDRHLGRHSLQECPHSGGSAGADQGRLQDEPASALSLVALEHHQDLLDVSARGPAHLEPADLPPAAALPGHAARGVPGPPHPLPPHPALQHRELRPPVPPTTSDQ